MGMTKNMAESFQPNSRISRKSLRIKENLKNLKDSSILIVSQRISTIMDADEILVIDNGEIVDRGNHNKLIESCEIYREIVNIQIDSMEALS